MPGGEIMPGYNSRITRYIDILAGKPVLDWNPQSRIQGALGACYALRSDAEEEYGGLQWTDKFAAFLDDPYSSEVYGIVTGSWRAPSPEMVEALVSARDRLPNLRAIFFGDITWDDANIFWDSQTDVSPLFLAYPRLEHFCVRGGVSVGSLKHDRLKSLVIESIGLSAEIVREVAAADLPELENLELWLGENNLGGDATVEDLAPILDGESFPKLKYLGLRNSEITDEIARALVASPIIKRIRVLDLSLGTLSDEGAAALLANPSIAKLEKLDIHHHFCSEEMTGKLESLGIEVDADGRLEPNDAGDAVWRYIAIIE
jgi:hypothetical protein